MSASSNRARRLQVMGAAPPYSPLNNAKISAWHQNTTLAGAISSVTDNKNTNPMAQADTDRQPTGQANGSMLFANKSLVLPMHASNNSTTMLGFGGWIIQPVSSAQIWIAAVPNPGGTDNWKFYTQLDSSRRITLDFYTSAGNGRRFVTAANTLPVAGTPFWLYWFYNSSLGGDANLRLSINGVTGLTGGAWSNVGTGGTGGDLNTVTGNYFIGNFANSDAGSIGFAGTLGEDFFTVQGTDVTADEELQMMNRKPLTV